MTSGDPRFFYGSDSAAHLPGKKHSYASCCGVFTADIGPLALAHSFDLMGKLGRLESFSSTNAMNFYRLTDPGERITLYRKEFVIPDSYGRCELVPFGRGTSLPWSY
jgi:dihydroorotase